MVVEETAFDQVQRLSFDLHERVIWVCDEIETDFGGWFAQVMRAMEANCSTKSVTVWLNTPGGDVQSMFAFYDIVQASKLEVIGIGHGQVVSAGVLMMACCNTRYVTENCVLMSHEGADYDSGGLRYSEAKERRKWEDWTHARWCELMARHTPHDAAYWRSLTNRKAEYWLLGGEAIVAEGLADKVINVNNKL